MCIYESTRLPDVALAVVQRVQPENGRQQRQAAALLALAREQGEKAAGCRLAREPSLRKGSPPLRRQRLARPEQRKRKGDRRQHRRGAVGSP